MRDSVMRRQQSSALDITSSVDRTTIGSSDASGKSSQFEEMVLMEDDPPQNPIMRWWHRLRGRRQLANHASIKRNGEKHHKSHRNSDNNSHKLGLSVLAGESGRSARLFSIYLNQLEDLLTYKERDVWRVRLQLLVYSFKDWLMIPSFIIGISLAAQDESPIHKASPDTSTRH